MARRLALLSAELAAVRRETDDATPGGQEVLPVAESWPWDQHTRIRGLDGPPDPEPPAHPAELPLAEEIQGWSVPVPGRHAARRAVLLSWVPAGLRGRVALQPAHLALVSVAVAVALAWTTWWAVSSRPEPDMVAPAAPDASPVAGAVGAAPSAPLSTTAPPASAPGHTGSSAPLGDAGSGEAGSGEAGQGDGGAGAGGAGEVVVDVAGRVRRPGLVVLPVGSRVDDALEAAGGPRRGVALTGLNLARVLVDGEQILVGVRPPAGTAYPGPPVPGQAVPVPPGAPAGLVNLNTADQVLLETLPGVGPVTAGAIVAWRTENGGFSSVEELLEVNGIGEVTLADLAPLVTV